MSRPVTRYPRWVSEDEWLAYLGKCRDKAETPWRKVHLFLLEGRVYDPGYLLRSLGITPDSTRTLDRTLRTIEPQRGSYVARIKAGDDGLIDELFGDPYPPPPEPAPEYKTPAFVEDNVRSFSTRGIRSIEPADTEKMREVEQELAAIRSKIEARQAQLGEVREREPGEEAPGEDPGPISPQAVPVA